MIISSTNSPVFQQVADQLRHKIAAGIFRAGEAVPSIRTQATALHINPNTIKRAYDELQLEGILEHRPGLGLFVTEAGAVKASTQSAQVLLATFESGVRIGVASRLPRAEIDGAYAKAWESLSDSPARAIHQENKP